MAREVQIGGDGALFVGEDKDFVYENVAIDVDDPENETLWVPVDMFGWDIRFDVRKKDNSPEPPFIVKTAAVDGTFQPTRAANQQRATVTVTDTDMNTLGGLKAATYRYSFKRMDDGVETVLVRGDFVVEKATAP